MTKLFYSTKLLTAQMHLSKRGHTKLPSSQTSVKNLVAAFLN